MNGKKLSAPAIGVPVSMVVVWLVELFMTINGITLSPTGGPFRVPGEIAAAFGAICTFVASLLIPDDKED